MSVFNQSRSGIIQIAFGLMFMIILGQLINLQVFSSKYKLAAENNAIYRKIIYPDRGIVYDRKNRSILENTIMYDLVVTPVEAKGIDTLSLCKLLDIDTTEYKKRIKDIAFKNGSVRPSVFEPLLSPEMYGRLNENMYKFPGFVLNERSARMYPYSTAANILGYTAEVDSSFLRKHKDEGYETGDYAGMTGLERNYEKLLMGSRGVKRFIRDNKSRIQGPFENGRYDTSAVAGKNLHLSLDVELQQLGEKLMTNKVGSIVAVNPKTGGILCMISAPTYNPNYLTGNQRRKHYGELALDPRLPLLNRTVSTKYSPGSTFKTIVGIIGLSEGVINESSRIGCSGAFYGCGNGKPKCLDPGYFNLKEAIAHSCNTYFATVFKRTLDQPKFNGADSGLKSFNEYARSFGLGHRLGVDVPSEKNGNLPISSYYRKIFGRNWNSCNIISNAIGQGEVQTTIVQLANVMATIANRGYYYTPHLVDSIEGGDEYGLLDTFKVKHLTKGVPDSVFEDVQNGMQAVMEFGTGAEAKVPGIVVCGKTGTVQNSAKVNGVMVKQKDHAFFGAFAPRDNPRIAIAMICENAGFGAASSAPIASLMIEKYLKDSITEPERQARVEQLAKTNLIPPLMRAAMARMDSIKQAKMNSQLQIQQQKETDDTTEEDIKIDTTSSKEVVPRAAKAKPARDSGKKRMAFNNAAILTDERKNNYIKKTAKA
ncbi:penicillin-binding protein 2 [Parasediminibacterium sp. JCM 36343]|uniref:penicillin-binding protein 2 n=1 Tax=Parasediminibacterium sp. JCM 36343 TaxID=3374279 RepID=UPI00397C6B68